MSAKWTQHRSPRPIRWLTAALVGPMLLCIGCAQPAKSRSQLGAWGNPTPPPDRVVNLPGDGVRLACPTVDRVSAEAGPGEPPPLLLADAVDSALCRNPQLHNAWARIQSQSAQLGVARSAFYPIVQLGGREVQERTRFDAGVLVPDRDQKSSARFASITWRVLDFGARGASYAAAGSALDSALASHDAALQQVLLGVAAAYSDMQMAQARWHAAGQSVQLAEQSLTTVRRRVDRGAAAQSDSLQAAAAVARAALKRSRTEGAQARAYVTLQHAMGLDVDAASKGGKEEIFSGKIAQSRPVMPLAESPRADAAGALQEWLALAQQHPTLRSAEHGWREAQAKLDAAWAEDGPTLDFRQTRQLNGNSSGPQNYHSDESAISLTLTVPVFSGFSSRYQLQGAQAQVALKRAEWDDARLAIQRQVGLASADALHALRTWEAADHWVLAAHSALQSAQRRYLAGVADILELLGAQSAHNEAGEELFRAQSEWHAARLQLLASAGVLNRGTVLKDAALANTSVLAEVPGQAVID